VKIATDIPVQPDSAFSPCEPSFDALLSGPSTPSTSAGFPLTGKVVALEDRSVPLVLFPGQPGTAALVARSLVDLHEAHVGRDVLLVFDGGELSKPIVVGVMRDGPAWPLPEKPGNVEVVADDERLVVTARDQIVFRCGKASITLTKAGKILIEGEYVSSHSSGVIRLKGGSVQLN